MGQAEHEGALNGHTTRVGAPFCVSNPCRQRWEGEGKEIREGHEVLHSLGETIVASRAGAAGVTLAVSGGPAVPGAPVPQVFRCSTSRCQHCQLAGGHCAAPGRP